MPRAPLTPAVLVASALFLTACGVQVGGDITHVRNTAWTRALTPRIGKDVVIHLRGDAQGDSAIFAVSSSATGESRLSVYAGTLSAVGEGWVVVKNDASETWVPMSSILAIHVMGVTESPTLGDG